MDYAINEMEQETLNATRELAQKKLKPLRAEMDAKEQFSKEMYEEFRKSGMFGLWLPEKYGGLGGGITCLAMAFEELSRVCAGLALTPGTSALGAIPMFLAATAEQRERWCYDLASGKKLWAFALTEPEAGSDASSLKTTALKDGDYYVVNGTKHFISTGKEADFYTVAVNTNPARGARGISLLVIEKGTPGFSFGKKEEKMGIRTNPTYELIFENVRVPKENLLGSEGRGLLYVQETLDYSRPGVAAQAVGIAQGALDETIPYLRTRKQFGQPIITFQALAHKVAELAAKTEAGRALVYSITHRMDEEFLPAVKAALENGTTVHDELKKIKAAQKITDTVFSKVIDRIKEGMTEMQLKTELDSLIVSAGAVPAFDSIVAFGENTALPHAHAGDRKLKYGDAITLDFGAKLNGYCSDMTRSLAFGHACDEYRSVYNAVLGAKNNAESLIKAGMTGRECDLTAREYLAARGLDAYFTHSLGHSLGIDIHETPNLSPRSEEIIPEGAVTSVEPGIYLDGKFGIRIEDTVVFKKTGVDNLTNSTEQLIIL